MIKSVTFTNDCSVDTVYDAERFKTAIDNAKRETEYSGFLTSYSVEEYCKMKMFLLSYGAGGIAVKKNGDIVSVFKNPTIAKQLDITDVSGKLMFTALNSGGCKLDCYDGFLPNLYVKYGFVPVCKTKFQDELAPKEWNYERDSRPDVIYLRHNGDSVEKILKKSKSYKKYNQYNIPYVPDFVAAVKMRDHEISKLERPSIKTLLL